MENEKFLGIFICNGYGYFDALLSDGFYFGKINPGRRFDALIMGRWRSTCILYDDELNKFYLEKIGYIHYDGTQNLFYLDGYGYLLQGPQGLMIRISSG